MSPAPPDPVSAAAPRPAGAAPPDRASAPPREALCGADHCITCADEAVAMAVLAVDRARELALAVAEDGSRQSVEIALVGPVAPGDLLLVHAGTAIALHAGAAVGLGADGAVEANGSGPANSARGAR